MITLYISVKTCPKFLNWLLFVSFISLSLNVYLKETLPDLFPKINGSELVNDILIANIAGYIFYILSTRVPEVIRIRETGEQVIELAEEAALHFTEFVKILHNHNMQQYGITINRNKEFLEGYTKDIALLLSETPATTCKGHIIGVKYYPTLSWPETLVEHHKYSIKITNEILDNHPNFDTRLISYSLEYKRSAFCYLIEKHLSEVDRGLREPNDMMIFCHAFPHKMQEIIANSIQSRCSQLRQEYYLHKIQMPAFVYEP